MLRSASALLAALLATVLVVGPAQAAAPAPSSDLQADIDAILADPRLENAQVGVSVRDARSGRSLYARGVDGQLLPASNQKLPTAAAALGILGPDFTFRTSVLADGDDLYLRGTGDPTLQAADYDALAAAVAAAGVTTVAGRLVADDTWFDDQRLAPDWDPSDEPFAYAAQVSALTLSPDADFNAGAIRVQVTPGAQPGQPVAVALSPATDYVTVDNRATTGAPGSASSIAIGRERGTNTITVTGSYPSDGTGTQSLRTVDNPSLYAAAVFRDALESHGVQVQGPTVRGATPPGATTIADRASMPLGQLFVPFLKLSNNNIAEILVKSVGRKTQNEGTWDAGLRAVARYVDRLGVDASQLRLTDGSGLSRGNRTTPRQVGNLLRALRHKPWFPALYNALPIAGQPEPLVGGTLRARMRDTAAAGNVRAKTGTLTGATALSGYVKDPRGRPLIFSIIFNGYDGSAPKDLEDEIAVRLAAGARIAQPLAACITTPAAPCSAGPPGG